MKIIQLSLTILCVFMLSPLTIWAEEDAFTLTGEIVFVSERDGVYRNLYTMNANGSNVRQLTAYYEDDEETFVAQPQWSVDGTMVAYYWQDAGYNGIGLARADRGLFTSLFSDRTMEPITYIDWSGDGHEIVYDQSYDMRLCFFTPTKDYWEPLDCILESEDDVRDPTWSPDSKKLAYAGGQPGMNEIFTIARNGTNITNLTNHPAHDQGPAWSPDGSKIVFVSNRNGNNRLFVMRADGSNVQQLTSSVANDSDPTWSPDGQYIAFTRTYLNGNSEIFAMKANGSTQTRLTNNPGYDGQPDWKPATQMTLQKILLLSVSSGSKVANIPFRDEDIVAYNLTTGSWSLYFDGSDVGITTDIDALGMAWDSTLVMSFDVPTTVPGLGLVDDADLVRFVPLQLGLNTAGTFTLYAGSQQWGLTTDSEDIDALYSLQRDDVYFSTGGRANVPDVIAQDEDVINYYYYTDCCGDAMEGFWLALDGSQLALTTASEDIGGIGQDGDHRYYSTVGAFAMPGLSGDGADIFELTSDPATGQLQPTMFWDGSQHGFAGKIIDAFEIVYLTNVPVSAAALMAEEPAEVGDEVDNDYTTPDELIIYLPLISD